MADHSIRLKTRHATVMRVLHGEIRRYPGGYAEIAQATGRAVQTVINQFNPAAIERSPSLDLFLDVLEIVRARDTVAAIAAGIDLRVTEAATGGGAFQGAEAEFRDICAEMADVMSTGAAALADRRYDAQERAAMAKELQDVIAQAEAMRQRLLAGGADQ